jgi:hypothetical protein
MTTPAESTLCQRPPFGWLCTRIADHEGPCAALPDTNVSNTQFGYVDISVIDEKIDLINQRVEWLCQQLMMVMSVAQSNPMFRMAMNKAQKGANNAG